MYEHLHYRLRLFSVCIAWLLIAGCGARPDGANSRGAKPVLNEPKAKTISHVTTTHGHRRDDPYHWMRDDERKDPEVLAYLQSENDYADAVLKPSTDLRAELFEELKGRIKKDDSSVPVLRRNYWYYTRFESEREYPIYCRRKGVMSAPEEVILDVNELAHGHEYYSVGGFVVSEDEQLIAYTEDTVSRRIYTVRFKDLKSGKTLNDHIPGVSSSLAWAADNKTLFYVDKDDKTLRPYRVRRHVLGTPTSDDVTVHEESDESFYVGVSRSKSRRFIFIDMQSTLVSEVRALESSNPAGDFHAIVPRSDNVEYSVSHHEETFYIQTNQDALNFRLVAAPVSSSSDPSTWREVVPHRDDVLLSSVDVFQDYLVLGERHDGIRRLRVIRWADGAEHDVAFDEPLYVAYASGNPEFNTAKLRYVYSSLKTPQSVFEYDMSDRSHTLLKQDKVLGGFDPNNYRMERQWATSRDGERIPISIILPTDFVKDGSRPLYQYAYGSYGYSMDPWFSGSWLSLLDRGFGVAIAHIRGGQEMGRRWYDDGKMFNKMNTFTDFIDCSEFLIKSGYTSADRLVAGGGSAGGLLMGAVANLSPETYHVIYAAVPFVDVVNTMLDETIPLTTNEYDEWGNPNNPDSYHYMLSYSPYDQVKTQDYPHMVVVTGLHDSQVQYWEPAKWVARLRALKTDDNRIIFDTDLDAGHGGASGRFKRYEKTAMVYAFIMQMIDPNMQRWTLDTSSEK